MVLIYVLVMSLWGYDTVALMGEGRDDPNPQWNKSTKEWGGWGEEIVGYLVDRLV